MRFGCPHATTTDQTAQPRWLRRLRIEVEETGGRIAGEFIYSSLHAIGASQMELSDVVPPAAEKVHRFASTIRQLVLWGSARFGLSQGRDEHSERSETDWRDQWTESHQRQFSGQKHGSPPFRASGCSASSFPHGRPFRDSNSNQVYLPTAADQPDQAIGSLLRCAIPLLLRVQKHSGEMGAHHRSSTRLILKKLLDLRNS